ncbi:PEP-CTERM sorting domain-containing protein [Verrucomicrobiota bacterium sgz303538]
MISNPVWKTSLLAVSAATLLTPSLKAATLSYTAGDLFIGFRQEGTQTDYLINIGQASIYRDATSSFTLSIGNIGADLAALFGDGWATDPTVLWGVIGTSGVAGSGGDVANTMYASAVKPSAGVQADPYLRLSGTAQGNIRSDVASLGSSFKGQTSSTNSSVALLQPTSDPNSWAHFNPGGMSFSAYGRLESNFGLGVSNSALDLFRMQPSSTSGLPGSLEGTFTIANNGTVTFSAVPEPSAAAMLGLGVVLYGMMSRRRRDTAKA